MYLKAMEMTGFKSFMNRTKLDFEPGLTAVVGPNGCGKSNIADAVRWVLGEQSAKALRGNKMEDVIFNGTDARKPLGMAEVSITFADCESALNTEYNELTITRRVFRSGEGQYFINRTPCRLKDIQRLFMDTGVGTTSYSLMEQGRIDRILSARPGDRRAVFEEASGITKFKADKEEAIRKLQHTEANLLRLADVIREVKRQIGSLQRQAGKARRYKTLKDELRKLDIFATRKRLEMEDRQAHQINDTIEALREQLTCLQNEINALEADSSSIRESRLQTERERGSAHEAASHAQSKVDHTRQLIQLNTQRIDEHRERAKRDATEIDHAKSQIATYETTLTTLSDHMASALTEKAEAETTLNECKQRFESNRAKIDEARARIGELREKSIELECMASKLQNELVEIEQSERAGTIQRERLSAEKIHLEREANSYESKLADMSRDISDISTEVEAHQSNLENIEKRQQEAIEKRENLQQACNKLLSSEAAKRAQVELLRDKQHSDDAYPAGSRLILDETNPLGVDPEQVVGALADNVSAQPGYEAALEASLRQWADAVVVKDPEASMIILHKLENEKKGPARLLPLIADNINEDLDNGLISHVNCSDEFRPLLKRLVGNVQVVDTVSDIPSPPPPRSAYVTKEGSFVAGHDRMEFWMPDKSYSNPLARKHLLNELTSALEELERSILEHRSAISSLLVESQTLAVQAKDARTRLDKSRTHLAQKEGENQVVAKEASQARERLETVTWELTDLENRASNDAPTRESIITRRTEISEQRDRLTHDTQEQSRELPALEERHAELNQDLTERRIDFAQLNQKVEHLSGQKEDLSERLNELHAIVEGRSSGLEASEAEVAKLEQEIEAGKENIHRLGDAIQQHSAREEALQKNSEKQLVELQSMERALAQKRATLEDLRTTRGEQDVHLAESRMRKQNQIDRITAEYNISIDQLTEEPEPEWEQGELPLEMVETRVTELQTKIEAMGAVNLVAIEEYKELEERYTFLTSQERDLVNSKQQLMDMIRRINRTTSEMFRTTFEQVNENFQIMFRKLFNGGIAKLVLVNEEDVLECGIEIIARPPGKRLQNVSLLSGGERTMTAVALLFAIYLIKPSPFCLLDELDAALDDSNIDRFVKVLFEFLEHSQFLVITHNRQTIAAASVVYGVTMQEKGVSKIVSMKLGEDKSRGQGLGTPTELTASITAS